MFSSFLRKDVCSLINVPRLVHHSSPKLKHRLYINTSSRRFLTFGTVKYGFMVEKPTSISLRHKNKDVGFTSDFRSLTRGPTLLHVRVYTYKSCDAQSKSATTYYVLFSIDRPSECQLSLLDRMLDANDCGTDAPSRFFSRVAANSVECEAHARVGRYPESTRNRSTRPWV